MDFDEIIAEIEFVVSEIKDGSCLALVNGNRGADVSTDLSNLIADLLSDYLEREG